MPNESRTILRALLGHAHIDTTQIYTKIRPPQLKRAVTFYEDGAERLLGVEAGMVFYEVKSETRAVSRADVLRIEKVDVKDPYLTVIEGACREPQIGDPLATTQEFFRRQDQQGATDG